MIVIDINEDRMNSFDIKCSSNNFKCFNPFKDSLCPPWLRGIHTYSILKIVEKNVQQHISNSNINNFSN